MTASTGVCFRCGESGHRMRTCPLSAAENKPTRADGSRVLGKALASKPQAERKISRVKWRHARLCEQGRAVERPCAINGEGVFTCALDSYADVSLIGLNHAKRLGTSSRFENFDEPVQLDGFSRSLGRATCSRVLCEAKLTLAVGETGEIQLDQVDFLVLEDDLDVVIIGIPELAKLGVLPGAVLDQ